MNTIVHATARLCACPVDVALAHLSTAAGLARWNLGLWNCRETEPGVFTGVSLFDGATGWVRIGTDAARGLIDYAVGPDPTRLTRRIRAIVVAGEPLGHPADSCVVTLIAWRAAATDDPRWQRLVATHETELDLIQAQLGIGPH